MGHLDYYSYQAEARGVRSLHDVQRLTTEKAYVYDRIVLPWLPREKNSPIAEIACGHGSFLCWLSNHKYTQVIGVDSSPEQVSFARQTGAAVHQMEGNRWLENQPSGSLATEVAIDLIEHLTKDAFTDFLGQTHRVLSSGGRLIVRYPNGDSPLVGRNLFNDITHVWTYTTNCIETLGRMHGFRRFEFIDESSAAIRDVRWVKVPLSLLSKGLLSFLFWAGTKEKVKYWSPHMWACLER